MMVLINLLYPSDKMWWMEWYVCSGWLLLQ
jgi:hypothetical protein